MLLFTETMFITICYRAILFITQKYPSRKTPSTMQRKTGFICLTVFQSRWSWFYIQLHIMKDFTWEKLFSLFYLSALIHMMCRTVHRNVFESCSSLPYKQLLTYLFLLFFKLKNNYIESLLCGIVNFVLSRSLWNCTVVVHKESIFNPYSASLKSN